MKFFKKKTPEEIAAEQKRIDEKIEKMRASIENFKKKLDEKFILGTGMADAFRASFKDHLEKQGSSATKRWCQDVAKKLGEIDKINHTLNDMYTKKGQPIPPEFKEQNIKKFRKIFHSTTILDNKFLETMVKLSASQNAAVNAVKEELNELSRAEFKP